MTTDINFFACETTRKTGLQNQITRIEPINTSLVNGILPRLKNCIDILCFNPPYAVTPHEEVGSLGIEASWAGGIDGREVIDELLPFVQVKSSIRSQIKIVLILLLGHLISTWPVLFIASG